MTRAHFKHIAEALRSARTMKARSTHEMWLICVETMADALAVTNVSFQRGKFLDACGVER